MKNFTDEEIRNSVEEYNQSVTWDLRLGLKEGARIFGLHKSWNQN